MSLSHRPSGVLVDLFAQKVIVVGIGSFGGHQPVFEGKEVWSHKSLLGHTHRTRRPHRLDAGSGIAADHRPDHPS